MLNDNLMCDIQSQSQAFDLGKGRVMHTVETIKDVCLLLLSYSGTLITYCDENLIWAVSLKFYCNHDRLIFRNILERIANQVIHNLLQASFIQRASNAFLVCLQNYLMI